MCEILYPAPNPFPVYQTQSLFQVNGVIVSGSELASKDRTVGAHNEGYCQSLLRETTINIHSASHVIKGICECSPPSLFPTWGS